MIDLCFQVEAVKFIWKGAANLIVKRKLTFSTLKSPLDFNNRF